MVSSALLTVALRPRGPLAVPVPCTLAPVLVALPDSVVVCPAGPVMVPWPVALLPVTSELPVAVADLLYGPRMVPWLLAVLPCTVWFPVTIADCLPVGPVRVWLTLPAMDFLPAREIGGIMAMPKVIQPTSGQPILPVACCCIGSVFCVNVFQRPRSASLLYR
jgi:hypothetical protein